MLSLVSDRMVNGGEPDHLARATLYMRRKDVERASCPCMASHSTTAFVCAASGMMTSDMNMSSLSSEHCSSSRLRNGARP